MDNFLKQSVNFPQRVNQTRLDDLVLEDTVDETETILGHGQANILKVPDDEKTAAASETTKANKRVHKQQKLFSDRHLSSTAGNSDTHFKENEFAESSQFEDVCEKSEVVLLSRQIEDKAPYMLWKERQTKASVRQNDLDLSLPPIFASKICQKQEKPNVQLPTVYIRNAGKEKVKESQEEIVEVEQNISKQTIDLIDDDKASVASNPKVNLRMKLEQIKTGVKLDQKKHSGTTSVTVEGSSATENAEETIAKARRETTESEMDALEASHSMDKDFLQVKELRNVQHFQPVPLELEVAKDLKKLVLGSSSLTFRDEWKFQGFSFSDCPKLQYRIIQKKGGPCGIFSVVQAFVLRHLLFTGNLKSSSRRLEPNVHEKAAALASALAAIVWQAGQQKKSVVATLGKKTHLNPSSIRTDGITEKVLVVTLDRYEDLLYFLTQNIDQMHFWPWFNPQCVFRRPIMYSATSTRQHG